MGKKEINDNNVPYSTSYFIRIVYFKVSDFMNIQISV